MEVATMSGSAEGQQRGGSISQDGSRYVVTVDGRRLGAPGSLRAAAERLAGAIRDALPRDPNAWSVSVACANGGARVTISRPGGGGGAGSLHPCVEGVLTGRTLDKLHQALQAAAQIIGQCCSG